MTMTASPHIGTEPWTVDDLDGLPDDGHRYEIFDGGLLVTPSPTVSHGWRNELIRRVLADACPDDLVTLAIGLGVDMVRRRSYFVPDLTVVRAAAVHRDSRNLDPADVVLVAEVVSPSNRRVDLVLKRNDYGAAGIPHYWILDAAEGTLTVLTDPKPDGGYATEQVVRAGTTRHTAEPFEVTLDPADVF